MYNYKLGYHETGYSATAERSGVEPRHQADFAPVSIETANIIGSLIPPLNLIVWGGDNHDGW